MSERGLLGAAAALLIAVAGAPIVTSRAIDRARADAEP